MASNNIKMLLSIDDNKVKIVCLPLSDSNHKINYVK